MSGWRCVLLLLVLFFCSSAFCGQIIYTSDKNRIPPEYRKAATDIEQYNAQYPTHYFLAFNEGEDILFFCPNPGTSALLNTIGNTPNIQANPAFNTLAEIQQGSLYQITLNPEGTLITGVIFHGFPELNPPQTPPQSMSLEPSIENEGPKTVEPDNTTNSDKDKEPANEEKTETKTEPSKDELDKEELSTEPDKLNDLNRDDKDEPVKEEEPTPNEDLPNDKDPIEDDEPLKDEEPPVEPELPDKDDKNKEEKPNSEDKPPEPPVNNKPAPPKPRPVNRPPNTSDYHSASVDMSMSMLIASDEFPDPGDQVAMAAYLKMLGLGTPPEPAAPPQSPPQWTHPNTEEPKKDISRSPQNDADDHDQHEVTTNQMPVVAATDDNPATDHSVSTNEKENEDLTATLYTTEVNEEVDEPPPPPAIDNTASDNDDDVISDEPHPQTDHDSPTPDEPNANHEATPLKPGDAGLETTTIQNIIVNEVLNHDMVSDTDFGPPLPNLVPTEPPPEAFQHQPVTEDFKPEQHGETISEGLLKTGATMYVGAQNQQQVIQDPSLRSRITTFAVVAIVMAGVAYIIPKIVDYLFSSSPQSNLESDTESTNTAPTTYDRWETIQQELEIIASGAKRDEWLPLLDLMKVDPPADYFSFNTYLMDDPDKPGATWTEAGAQHNSSLISELRLKAKLRLVPGNRNSFEKLPANTFAIWLVDFLSVLPEEVNLTTDWVTAKAAMAWHASFWLHHNRAEARRTFNPEAWGGISYRTAGQKVVKKLLLKKEKEKTHTKLIGFPRPVPSETSSLRPLPTGLNENEALDKLDKQGTKIESPTFQITASKKTGTPLRLISVF